MKIKIPRFLGLLIVCFGLAPLTQAVVPAPDGGYPGFNAAEGQNALFSLTTGAWNTAVGAYSLFSDTGGDFNTAMGTNALRLNTGNYNTANGVNALYGSTTGAYNTASGVHALEQNTSGMFNTAIGAVASHSNAGGNANTAVGVSALFNNTGNYNTALGYAAGSNLTTGAGNVCIGYFMIGIPGETNTTRIRNIANTVVASRAVYVDTDNRLGTLFSTRRVKEDIKRMDKASEAILVAQTGHLPLQERGRSCAGTLVWLDCRGSGSGESRVGDSECQRRG